MCQRTAQVTFDRRTFRSCRGEPAGKWAAWPLSPRFVRLVVDDVGVVDDDLVQGWVARNLHTRIVVQRAHPRLELGVGHGGFPCLVAVPVADVDELEACPRGDGPG